MALLSALTGSFCPQYSPSWYEIHQVFVPGHSAEVRDVFIDSVGVLLELFILDDCLWNYEIEE
ncbi:VanZ family protein [Bacillus niameyensis]|uniref:VanZ family protein n=1 Tax=Bacillus niameyensis TaxID=1522308 RepID=UPI0018A7EECD|nr:VanZ family protein [Bacillus niameyensis]